MEKREKELQIKETIELNEISDDKLDRIREILKE